MASPLYKRYIPAAKIPSQSGPRDSELPGSGGKKRKRAEDEDVQSKDEAKSTNNHESLRATHQNCQDPTEIATLREPKESKRHQKSRRRNSRDNPSLHNIDETLQSTEGIPRAASEINKKPERTKKRKKGQRDQREKRDDVVESAVVLTDVESGNNVEKQNIGNHTLATIQYHDEQNDDVNKIDDAPNAKGTGTQTKHKSIRSKFERSSKLAELKAQRGDEEPTLDNARAENHSELHDLVPLPQPEPVQETAYKPSFSALPSWLAKPILVSPTEKASFEGLQITPKVLAAFKSKGYDQAFAVQSAVLPLLLPGVKQQDGDVCISAATGSGKTLAYMLPITESLRNRTVIRLKALIVVPTRELVTQAREVCELCATGSGLKIGTGVGSKSLKEEQELLVRKGQIYNPERDELQKEAACLDADGLEQYNLKTFCKTLPGHVREYASRIDILICTPGRLVDHIRSTEGFSLDHVQWLVIDEADRLLNESFQEWMEVLMKTLETEKPYDQLGVRQKVLLGMGYPKEHREIRKVILSATMTRDVGKLSALKLRRPKLVAVDTAVPDVAENPGDRDQVTSEGAKLGPEAGHGGYDLPLTLHEKALTVGDGQDKPLFLLELLRTNLGVTHVDRHIPSSAPVRESSIISSSDPVSAAGVDDGDSTEDDDSTTSSSLVSSASSTSGTSEASRNAAQFSRQAIDRTELNGSNHGVLIFTNNNENAQRLARLLSIMHPPYSSEIRTLTKFTTTSSRRQILSAFRAHNISILIASDRASRGLDLENLGVVINYDIPTSITAYVHRVGRTARAGKPGQAWTLITHSEARWFWTEIGRGNQIRRGAGKRVERAKLDLDLIGDDGKMAYAEALTRLGEEAHGKINRR